MPNQVKRPAMAVILANQLNTLPEPEWTPMYAKRANEEETMSALTGNPFRSVLLNIAGALPAMARPSVGGPSRTMAQWGGLSRNMNTHTTRANLCTDHSKPQTKQRSEDTR